jgi:hypothetical protein
VSETGVPVGSSDSGEQVQVTGPEPPIAPPPARPSARSAQPTRPVMGPGKAVVLVVSAAAILYGVLLRVWLLVHMPVWGDEAIVGLQARAIDGGHFSAFYWGQHYGGLEPYLVAAALKIGGGGEPALNATPAVLAAAAAALLGAAVFIASRNRLLALAAGAAVWVWPYVVVWQSVREGGFRFATLCCGLIALVCCVLACQRRAGAAAFVVLGLALGLGWWASPEIAYFALPCLVLAVGWWVGSPHAAGPSHLRPHEREAQRPSRPRAAGLVALGVVVGSLPWWYANAHTGFASLQRSALPANGGATYGSKLSVFFHAMLPMQLGCRTVLSGAWVGGPAVGKTAYAGILAVVAGAVLRAVLHVVRGGGAWVPLALASGVVAYPFLYAAAPGTDYWIDGRYGIYLPALVVALLASVLASFCPFERRRPAVEARVAWAAAAGVVCVAALTLGAAHSNGVPASPAFFSGWHEGDAPMEAAIGAMRAHHIDAAYGDYWTAYDLDFLSGGRPVVSPSPLLDVSRSTQIAVQVASARDPAWLFFAPTRAAQAARVFVNPQPGPGPYTEQTFEAQLRHDGIGYRVVHLGILDAVVPARRIRAP